MGSGPNSRKWGHSPFLEYLAEALGLGLFMVAAGLVATALDSPRSRLHALIESADIDNGIADSEIDIVEPLLWQPAVNGHLSAFETVAHGAAGARLLTFVAFA